ncbi:MAG: DUF4416 family protein [Candidatus Omnitrophica bacterium]|nr:DUF4416 family protein [Candidatus Omnitrophota bacterium]
MGKISSVRPVKLFIGLIFKDQRYFKEAESILIKKFGKADFKSEIMPFDLTDYYRPELGDGLKRVFISFKRLINPAHISRIKRMTNKIELRLSCSNKRLINIDPGYLDLPKVILASTKDYAHRIYLDKGIFAEITLSFKDNSFTPKECTYPDYRKKEYIDIFNKIRSIYQGQI